MNQDFTIGDTPIGTETPCKLKFHEFVIYDSENWTQTGVVKWDAVNKQFYVVPDV